MRMRVGQFEDRTLGDDLVAALKDGSYITIPSQYVISYNKNRTKAEAGGVGLGYEQIAHELQEHGEIHIARQLNHRGPHDVLKAADVVELYSVRKDCAKVNQLIPPKRGLRKLLWRLSML